MSPISPDLRAKLADQEWRLNNLYWVVDNRDGVAKRVRFRMNEAQREILDEMWFRTIIPKSRQHGVTTFMGIFFLDQCLFVPNIRAGIIAHNDEDAEAIFRDKVKYPYDNLPPELREIRAAKTDRRRELLFSNNSSIRVIPSGRSGSYNLVHVSEFGRICMLRPDHADEIVAGTFEAVAQGNYIIIESTAHGRMGKFYEMCDAAHNLQLAGKQPGPLDFKLHFIPWWKKPENVLHEGPLIIHQRMLDYFADLKTKHGIALTDSQKRWYIAKEATLGANIKSEHPSTYEECFEKTIEGSYYAAQFRSLRENKRITAVPYYEGSVVDTWWDLGYNDVNSIWFTQDIGRAVHVIDYYENAGEGLPHYVDVLRERGYRYGRHVGPFDIETHEWGTGKTRIETARDLGIRFDVAPKLDDVMDGIEAVRKILSICWFDEAKCGPGLNKLEAYRKEWDDRLGTWKNRPLHDEASHAADAFRTFATAHGMGYRGSVQRKEIKRTTRHRVVV